MVPIRWVKYYLNNPAPWSIWIYGNLRVTRSTTSATMPPSAAASVPLSGVPRWPFWRTCPWRCLAMSMASWGFRVWVTVWQWGMPQTMGSMGCLVRNLVNQSNLLVAVFFQIYPVYETKGMEDHGMFEPCSKMLKVYIYIICSRYETICTYLHLEWSGSMLYCVEVSSLCWLRTTNWNMSNGQCIRTMLLHGHVCVLLESLQYNVRGRAVFFYNISFCHFLSK